MKKLFFILVTVILITACGGDDIKPAKEVSIEPTEMFIIQNKTKDFSIVLDDMKIGEESDFMVYQHKYNILTVKNDSLHTKETDWATVSQDYFVKHENDLGMEIVSNHDNKLSRVAQPVGFGWAIGNKKHGEWEAVQKDSTSTASTSNNNNRRWRSNNSSFFFWYWLGSRRNTYARDYNGYQTNRRQGLAYYGSRNNSYGTQSAYQQSKRSSFFTRKKNNSSTWNSHKTSRSSSRYSSGSSTRSRSGGYGK